MEEGARRGRGEVKECVTRDANLARPGPSDVKAVKIPLEPERLDTRFPPRNPRCSDISWTCAVLAMRRYYFSGGQAEVAASHKTSL